MSVSCTGYRSLEGAPAEKAITTGDAKLFDAEKGSRPLRIFGEDDARVEVRMRVDRLPLTSEFISSWNDAIGGKFRRVSAGVFQNFVPIGVAATTYCYKVIAVEGSGSSAIYSTAATAHATTADGKF
jgi:hypothetical protein